MRHLTLASNAQQRDWLALVDDPDTHAPLGHQLKAWLFGGASISTKVALFDLAMFKGEVVADLFGEDSCFACCDEFWEAQRCRHRRDRRRLSRERLVRRRRARALGVLPQLGA